MRIRNFLLSTALLFVILVLSACTTPIEEPPIVTPAAKICANIWTPYYSSGMSYLGVVNGLPCLNAGRLIIVFVEPVESVELSFSGASQPYVLQVYDESGTLLGSQVEQAEFNNGDGALFVIGYSSDSANIKRVRFGGPLGGPTMVIAVRGISFSRAGTQSPYNFDTFPDGSVIAGDTQDTEGREWRSLTGNEFVDWGFLVSTDLDEQ